MHPSDINLVAAAESTSTARRKRARKLNPHDAPISARSNNLELWLSKKKALDQQSQSNKQSKSSRRKRVKGASNEEGESQSALEPLSESSSNQELSLLSKLQQSSLSINKDSNKQQRGSGNDENDSQMVNFQIRDEMPGAGDEHQASGSPTEAGGQGNRKGDGAETAKK